jgi:murein DD-endopeptidase MepM/ murein hydrolase activator NlpD
VSGYVYQSRSIQPTDGGDVQHVADELRDALRGNPVIHNFKITVHPLESDDEDHYAIDIVAQVDADQRSRFSGITAFASADEAWLDALEICGLERATIRSRMDARDRHQ